VTWKEGEEPLWGRERSDNLEWGWVEGRCFALMLARDFHDQDASQMDSSCGFVRRGMIASRYLSMRRGLCLTHSLWKVNLAFRHFAVVVHHLEAYLE